MHFYHVNKPDAKGDYIHYAEGFEQWLGDGYYFWQDYEFAEEWIRPPKSDVYTAELNLRFDGTDDRVLDTVFCEKDYRQFLKAIEAHAVKFYKIYYRYPTLEEFNEFIEGKRLWREVKAVRFQELPKNNNKNYLKVKKFFYKKRIQIVVSEIAYIRIVKKETITK